MKDGALADRAFTIKQWHTKQDIKLYGGWLGNRPDLNPIKSLWSQIKQLQNKEHATLAAGLKRIALNVWREILPTYLKSLYESMPRRIKAFVDAQGGHTKY